MIAIKLDLQRHAACSGAAFDIIADLLEDRAAGRTWYVRPRASALDRAPSRILCVGPENVATTSAWDM